MRLLTIVSIECLYNMLKIYQNSSDTHGAHPGRTKYKNMLIMTHNYRIRVCCACKHDMKRVKITKDT